MGMLLEFPLSEAIFSKVPDWLYDWAVFSFFRGNKYPHKEDFSRLYYFPHPKYKYYLFTGQLFFQ